MPQKKALIICNGDPPVPELLERLWPTMDIKLCADGGANFLVRYGKIPDYVVGDMDSIEPHIRERILPQTLIHIAEQQTNDADKTIHYCLQHQAKEVHLLGASGGRSDQFFANLEILYKYTPTLKMILWTHTERIEVIEGHWKGELPPNTPLSLLPLFGSAYGIQTQGLQYSLNNEHLIPGREPCGVSNQVISAPVSITIDTGKLFLVTPWKPWFGE